MARRGVQDALSQLLAMLPEVGFSASVIHQEGDRGHGVVIDINRIEGRKCGTCQRAEHLGECTPRPEELRLKDDLCRRYMDLIVETRSGRDLEAVGRKAKLLLQMTVSLKMWINYLVRRCQKCIITLDEMVD